MKWNENSIYLHQNFTWMCRQSRLQAWFVLVMALYLLVPKLHPIECLACCRCLAHQKILGASNDDNEQTPNDTPQPSAPTRSPQSNRRPSCLCFGRRNSTLAASSTSKSSATTPSGRSSPRMKHRGTYSQHLTSLPKAKTLPGKRLLTINCVPTDKPCVISSAM